ncbi:MAG: hypothetical protein V3U78_05450 [Thiotrichaceae bacterium]
MDEIEMDILEMEMEFQEIMEGWKQEDRKKPDWWLIALGSKEASRASYEKSCDIYRHFKSFSFLHTGKDFFEIVDLFTTAMIQNRLSGDYRK